MPNTPPTATVAGQSIALHVTGYPDVPNRWGSGHIRVASLRLDYGSSVSPDARHVFVVGTWVRDDGELTDASVDRYYDAPTGDMSDWPDWIADLTRKHTPSAPADRATVLREATEVAVRAARGCGDSEAGQYAASVAAGIGKELRRMADEAQQQPHTETPCERCGHGRQAHNISGCIACPGGWRADHRFMSVDEPPADRWSVEYHRPGPARLNPAVCTCGLGPDAIVHNEPPHAFNGRPKPGMPPVYGVCADCHHHETAFCHTVAEEG